LLKLSGSHGLRPHAHADDDTQIYGSCSLAAAARLQMQMSACIDEVALWMARRR